VTPTAQVLEVIKTPPMGTRLCLSSFSMLCLSLFLMLTSSNTKHSLPDQKTAEFVPYSIRFGSRGDSFYEYLLYVVLTSFFHPPSLTSEQEAVPPDGVLGVLLLFTFALTSGVCRTRPNQSTVK
jgi:hypothetical protein